jgi:calcium/calmodulin-dependent protein kinase I
MAQPYKTRLVPITNLKCEDVYNEENYGIGFVNKGNFAVVLSAVNKKDSSRKYAVKVIDMEKFVKANDQVNLDRVQREIEINGIISHRNIVIVYEVYLGTTECSLVMELMGGGDLFSRIVDNGCMDESETKFIITQILDAVKYLHSIHIAHRDIKPENIVFDKPGPEGIAKLIDFGFSKIESHGSDNLLKTPVGSVGYFAPEIIQTDSYRLSVDMWSIGCIVYFMLTQKPPFHAKTEKEIESLSVKAEFSFPDGIVISERAKDFVCNLLQLNPEDRMTAEESLEHKWFYQNKLTNSGNKTSSTASRIDSAVKSKMRSQINQIIDAERKVLSSSTPDLPETLGGINLDATENPFWQARKKKKQSDK